MTTVEMKGDGLDQALITLAAQLIENQRQDDGEREAQYDAHQADFEGVPHDQLEFGQGEHPREMLQAHPRAAPDTKHRLVILKGNLNAIHGHIAEHKHQHHRRHQKQIQFPALRHPKPQAFLMMM